ncbi:MAG: septum formation inhibitor Maf [Nitrospirales bacterium]|nr:septum formation inhibitor Maf [Nitrospirales bacterium]
MHKRQADGRTGRLDRKTSRAAAGERRPPVRIVLASASPRRREILEKAGLRFTVDAGEYEEDMGLHLPPHRLARHLSGEKAKAVAPRHRDALLIAADTFIVFRDRLLGKPHTAEAAREMLSALSGKTHSVITGFTLLDTASRKRVSGSVETKVSFKRLTGEEIEAYIATKEPLDKAGAYAIQGVGAVLIRKIEGDYFNVMGLPLSAVADALKKFGVRIL